MARPQDARDPAGPAPARRSSAPAAGPRTPAPARRIRNRSQRQLDESAGNKATIVRTAAEVFAERGYNQTTLDAVAGRVGLTRPGILYHFASKEALFRAVLDQDKEWAAAQVGDENRAVGLDGVRELAAFLGGGPQARIPLQLVHVLEGEGIAGNQAAQDYVRERSTLVRGEIMTRLERAQAQAAIPAEVDLSVLAALIAATVNGLQKQWLIDPSADTGAAFALLVDLIEAGATAGTFSDDIYPTD